MNRTDPPRHVKSSARAATWTGAQTERSGRASMTNLAMGRLLHRHLHPERVEVSRHREADMVDAGRADRNGFRQAAPEHHLDAVRDLEEFVEFLGDDQQSGACITKVDEFLADGGCRPDIDTPCRLRRDEDLG